MVVFLTKLTSKDVRRLDVNLNKFFQLTKKQRHLVGLTLSLDIHYKMLKVVL